MKKQTLMFSDMEDQDGPYTNKIDAPTYEPRHVKPHLMTLCDASKTRKLIAEIEDSDLPENEKEFLRAAAWRHAVFNYELIADYYAHSSAKVQTLMEQSALVIIDIDAAIEQGFVRVCGDIRGQYMEEYIDTK